MDSNDTEDKNPCNIASVSSFLSMTTDSLVDPQIMVGTEITLNRLANSASLMIFTFLILRHMHRPVESLQDL